MLILTNEMKHIKYFRLLHNLKKIHFIGKKLYIHKTTVIEMETMNLREGKNVSYVGGFGGTKSRKSCSFKL